MVLYFFLLRDIENDQYCIFPVIDTMQIPLQLRLRKRLRDKLINFENMKHWWIHQNLTAQIRAWLKLFGSIL